MKKQFMNHLLALILVNATGILHTANLQDDSVTSKVSLDHTIIAKSQNNNRTQKRTELINSWKPYGIHNCYIQNKKNYFFRADVGPGFLYFSGVRANLQIFLDVPAGEENLILQARRDNDNINGKLGYNRTPCFEFQVGSQLAYWASIALSYVHQGNVSVLSKKQTYHQTVVEVGAPPETVQVESNFSSTLSLDAILFKAYFNYPCSLIWKTISYNPYVGLGFGPGWQTWADNIVTQSFFQDSADRQGYSSYPYRYKSKISCNPVWMADVGLKLRSVLPNLNFAVHFGAKFMGWGQARQVGKYSQNRNVNNQQLVVPFRVQYVLSLVPYMGVSWMF